jgi:hypothetical protein
MQVPGPALRASLYARKRRFFDLLVETMAPDNPDAAVDGLLVSDRGRGRADRFVGGRDLLHEVPPDPPACRVTIRQAWVSSRCSWPLPPEKEPSFDATGRPVVQDEGRAQMPPEAQARLSANR